MATWVIGDVHGCYKPLKKLVRRLELKPHKDTLWMTGDLVNRGPKSDRVLRWSIQREQQLGDRFQVVLGNHDLHALAVHYGVRRARQGDTLKVLMKADDRKSLMDWLVRRPFLVRQGKQVLVHAGLLPEWTPKKAERIASQLSGRLIANPKAFLKGNKLGDRQKDALAALTRLRTLNKADRPGRYSGPLDKLPKGLTPWFRHPERRSAKARILCGHWAALGLHQEANVSALDTGCVWGGTLTAIRLSDGKIIQEPR